MKSEEKKAAQEVLEAEEARRASEQWEALEAAIEADFEAIRSRNADAHAVPNHCGEFTSELTSDDLAFARVLIVIYRSNCGWGFL